VTPGFFVSLYLSIVYIICFQQGVKPMKPVQAFSEFDFVCTSDLKEPEKDQTIFVLTSLTVEQEAYIDDHVQGEDGLKYGTVILDVLNMGLKQVKNFNSGKTQIKFKRDEKGMTYPGGITPWKSEFLSKIPVKDRREISAKIRSLGTIEDEEAKNS